MNEAEVVEGLLDLPKEKLRVVLDTLLDYSHSDCLWGDLEELLKEAES